MDTFINYSPEYYWQKPHLDLANRLIHNRWYKMLNPLHTRNYRRPETEPSRPLYYGVPPESVWLYGNLDYTMNKQHKLYQAHDDWYPDRKAKSLGYKNGALQDKRGSHTTHLALKPTYVPRGCNREIKKFKDCSA